MRNLNWRRIFFKFIAQFQQNSLDSKMDESLIVTLKKRGRIIFTSLE